MKNTHKRRGFIPALLLGTGIILTGYVCSASAQQSVVSTFTLANGMEAVVIEDHRAPVVTHMVWYKVGSADEVAGKSGIAHFLEHLMFVGTDDIAEGQFSQIVESYGGNDNAFTSYDYTSYFQRISSEHLELVMKMEADRMRDLVLNQQAVDVEREVIIAERNLRTDSNPGALFSEQRRAIMFMNHRYGIPIIGWRHEVEQLTLEDALDFYQKYYAPNNAILVVAGDVTPEQVEELANKYYGPLQPSKDIQERQRPQEPPQLAARRLEFQDERVANPYVIRSYLAPDRKSGDQHEAATLTVLAELFASNEVTSVFGKALQIDEQIAISTGAYYDSNSLDPETFTIYVMPAPGVSLAMAEAKLDEVLVKFLETGPTQEQLDRLKTEIRADEIYALDNQNGLARRYGAALAIGLTVEDVASWPDALNAVTIEDIMAAAESILDINKSVTGWLTKPQEVAE